ncbi:hypothetical protein DMJ13_17175 [halophilic archaeon]|nr:hypothetical protein DMJ13_17175 [halophilic archaeon]
MSKNATSTEPQATDESVATSDQRAEGSGEELEDLRAQLDLLTEENARLRAEYQRARQAKHRRTAIGFAVCGVLAGLAAVLFSASRTVLFALAGTGLFAAVLTYYLTPERFVTAAVSERVYAATAAWGETLRTELGLQNMNVYLPSGVATNDEFAPVRLFVPQYAEYALPDGSSLDAGFVIPEDDAGRGLVLQPTGAALYEEFESQVDTIAESPSELASQLTDALVESFELVEDVTFELDSDELGITFAITGSSYGTVDRFDHPIQSFLAVGLAHRLDQPITVERQPTNGDDDRFDYRIHCSWESLEQGR